MQPQHNKANLKTWWNNIKGGRKDPNFQEPYRPHDTADHPVFGKSLRESLKYASVQISTAAANGDLYVWGYIPVVVAKCGLYLKETATEVPGTFRVNGSNRRMRELQAAFETPPRYGKSLDWRTVHYTTHDVASVFRRYLTQMPEPVIPYDMYHLFRDALAKQPFNQEVAIATYKSLIRKLPKPNQYLLLYVLDLLSVFARKSDRNLMTATNLAVIFRPGLISHPSHERYPEEHGLSQRVLEFLIAQQDWFMLDISPPSPGGHTDDIQGSGSRRKHSYGQGVSADQSPSNNGHGHHTNGKWPESTNTPGPAWRTKSGTVGWNLNPDAGPSTPRQRVGSVPAWYSASQPELQGRTPLGQLAEQITPTPSVPASPIALHFERARSNPSLSPSTSNNMDVFGSQQRRPSSPPTLSLAPQPSKQHPQAVSRPGTPTGSTSDVDELMIIPSGASFKSAEEEDPQMSLVPGGGGWKIIGKNVGGGMIEAVQGWQQAGASNSGHVGGFIALGGPKKVTDKQEEDIKMLRRRTTIDRTGTIPQGQITPIQETPLDTDLVSGSRLSGVSVQRSRTLPTRRRDKVDSAEDLLGAATDKENDRSGPDTWDRKQKDREKDKPGKRVLKKHRPARASTGQSFSTTSASMLQSLTASPVGTPIIYSAMPSAPRRDEESSGGPSGS